MSSRPQDIFQQEDFYLSTKSSACSRLQKCDTSMDIARYHCAGAAGTLQATGQRGRKVKLQRTSEAQSEQPGNCNMTAKEVFKTKFQFFLQKRGRGHLA
jgi:hypothetical protein